jgi:hypothetical protein
VSVADRLMHGSAVLVKSIKAGSLRGACQLMHCRVKLTHKNDQVEIALVAIGKVDRTTLDFGDVARLNLDFAIDDEAASSGIEVKPASSVQCLLEASEKLLSFERVPTFSSAPAPSSPSHVLKPLAFSPSSSSLSISATFFTFRATRCLSTGIGIA